MWALSLPVVSALSCFLIFIVAAPTPGTIPTSDASIRGTYGGSRVKVLVILSTVQTYQVSLPERKLSANITLGQTGKV